MANEILNGFGLGLAVWFTALLTQAVWRAFKSIAS